MLEEFVEHVCEGAKGVQKAIMGGPKAMQEVRDSFSTQTLLRLVTFQTTYRIQPQSVHLAGSSRFESRA